MEPAKIGTKELSEVIAAVELLGVSGKVMLKDGKVSVSDLPELMKLVASAQKIVDAVEGIEGVVPEVKDLDGEEAKEVVGKIFAMIAAIKAA